MLKIAALYAAFSALAICVNIFTQIIAINLLNGPLAVSLSVLAGTATGLISKYALDKRFIFRYVPDSYADEATKLARYTTTGLFTTGLFWGTEYTFHTLFHTDAMRYLGGVVGLTIGYALKYHLDKRHVFFPPSS